MVVLLLGVSRQGGRGVVVDRKAMLMVQECEGPALTGEEETEEDKGNEPKRKDLRSKRRGPENIP